MDNSKEFDEWNNVKKNTAIRERVFFDKGDVWFASIGKNIGDEEDGKNEYFERPVLITRKFNNNVFLALPLTSTSKTGKFYHSLESFSGSVVILSQIRLLDSKRLLRFMGKISTEELEIVKNKIRQLV